MGSVINRYYFDSLEQLPLSLCTYPFPLGSSLRTACFFKKGIWLRIAHFSFQGFSEFGSYHLAGFHTKAQYNQVRSVYRFRHIPILLFFETWIPCII